LEGGESSIVRRESNEMSKLNEPLIKADLHPLMILWREEGVVARGDEKQDCSTRRENDAARSSSSSHPLRA